MIQEAVVFGQICHTRRRGSVPTICFFARLIYNIHILSKLKSFFISRDLLKITVISNRMPSVTYLSITGRLPSSTISPADNILETSGHEGRLLVLCELMR